MKESTFYQNYDKYLASTCIILQEDSYKKIIHDAEKIVLKKFIQRCLERVSPNGREVLEMRFGLIDGNTHTLEEVGEKFGQTRERIRQIEAKSLERMKDYIIYFLGINKIK